MTATIAITFDHHASGYAGAMIMRASGRNLVGTFYVDPFAVGGVGTLSQDQLLILLMNGFEIGAYTGNPLPGMNMVQYHNEQGRTPTRAYLKSLKTKAEQIGFPVRTLAPNSRAWGLGGVNNLGLRNMVSDLFEAVRAPIQGPDTQELPVPDPLYVAKGGTTSFNATDTFASLSAQLDTVISEGKLWVPVVHKVGEDADPTLSISTAIFTQFCDRVAQERDAGNLRVVTFLEATRLS